MSQKSGSSGQPDLLNMVTVAEVYSGVSIGKNKTPKSKKRLKLSRRRNDEARPRTQINSRMFGKDDLEAAAASNALDCSTKRETSQRSREETHS